MTERKPTRFVLTSDLEAGTNRLVIVLNDTHSHVLSSDLMEVEAGMKSVDFLKEYTKRVSHLVSDLVEHLEKTRS